MSKLALLGGAPVRSEPYPQWPVFDQRDIDAVTNVVRSGRWGGFPYPGPQSKEFIRRFAEMQGGGFWRRLLPCEIRNVAVPHLHRSALRSAHNWHGFGCAGHDSNCPSRITGRIAHFRQRAPWQQRNIYRAACAVPRVSGANRTIWLGLWPKN